MSSELLQELDDLDAALDDMRGQRNTARRERDALKAEVVRLREAGEKVAYWLRRSRNDYDPEQIPREVHYALNDWNAALAESERGEG